MKADYSVSVTGFDILRELENTWTASDFSTLLDLMEYGDTSEISTGELREMCLLSMQDLKPHECAALLLNYKLADRLSEGEIRNASHEMLDEKLWEEFADMSLHESMFVVASLLYSVRPEIFPEPDAVRVRLSLCADNSVAMSEIDSELSEAFLIRLLADGMEKNAVLWRIFEDQLCGHSFPEADNIVWTADISATDTNTREIEIISSGYWLDSLRNTRAYSSHAYPDRTDNSLT